jgi:hypothetical protein
MVRFRLRLNIVEDNFGSSAHEEAYSGGSDSSGTASDESDFSWQRESQI